MAARSVAHRCTRRPSPYPLPLRFAGGEEAYAPSDASFSIRAAAFSSA